MPHVDVHSRVYLGAGHHRRPRNSQPWIEPYSGSAFDPIPGTPITETAPPSLNFVPPGSSAIATATFAFWSRSSASAGATTTSTHFADTVGSENITLIAWYYLPGGGGTGGDGGTAELIDAYSVSLGTFIDDDFVTVPSDPSLASAANVDGVVPTTVAETVDAFSSMASTAELFDEWVRSPDGGTAAGEVLSLPAGSNGFAFATYARRQVVIPKLPNDQYTTGVIIITGIIDDSPGLIWVDGHPVPVDPGWGSLIAQIFTIAAISHDAGKLSREGAMRVRSAAAAELHHVAQHLGDIAKRGLEHKG